jgi:hypothetical protein
LLYSLSRMYEFLSSEEKSNATRKAYLYGAMRKWRTRAFMFATALDDPKVQEKQINYEDAPRIHHGIPDHPYGLMEGISGEICFLSDLLR